MKNEIINNEMILELRSIGINISNECNIDHVLDCFKQKYYYDFNNNFYQYKNDLYKATYDKSFMDIQPIYDKLKFCFLKKLIQCVK